MEESVWRKVVSILVLMDLALESEFLEEDMIGKQ